MPSSFIGVPPLIGVPIVRGKWEGVGEAGTSTPRLSLVLFEMTSTLCVYWRNGRLSWPWFPFQTNTSQLAPKYHSFFCILDCARWSTELKIQTVSSSTERIATYASKHAGEQTGKRRRWMMLQCSAVSFIARASDPSGWAVEWASRDRGIELMLWCLIRSTILNPGLNRQLHSDSYWTTPGLQYESDRRLESFACNVPNKWTFCRH